MEIKDFENKIINADLSALRKTQSIGLNLVKG